MLWLRKVVPSLLVVMLALAFPVSASADDAKRRAQAEQLVEQFWQRVWTPPSDLTAVDDLVVDDFVLTNAGGSTVTGRAEFRAWIEKFQSKANDVKLQAFETFANADASRVTSRWKATGINNGVLGLAPDGREISFTGIAIWEIRWTADGPKLAHNWVERSAWELYKSLTR